MIKPLVFLLLLSQPLFAQTSIVGVWAANLRECKITDVIQIKPLEILSDSFYCKFTNVSRIGNKVTWNGSCEADRQGIEMYKETVTAELKVDKLHITFARNLGKFDVAPLVRCR